MQTEVTGFSEVKLSSVGLSPRALRISFKPLSSCELAVLFGEIMESSSIDTLSSEDT
jgi:hypothetical protein